MSFAASGGKIQATRCAGGRWLGFRNHIETDDGCQGGIRADISENG